MVFLHDFVCVVKVNGKVLREQDGGRVVYLPFMSEYSLLLKNLNSRRAVVKVSIDGQDVLNGNQLIVEPNSSIELERFIADDLCRGKRFRFIQKTKEIVDHRGDRPDDGIVRVEYQFEAPPPVIKHVEEVHHHHHHNWPPYTTPIWPKPYWSPYGGIVYGSNAVRGMGGGGTCSASGNLKANLTGSQANYCVSALDNAVGACYDALQEAVPAQDEGITVQGSESNQRFQQGYIGQLESASHVITIQLRGGKGARAVPRAVTVQTKLTCPTCGRSSASTAKFCANCGTAL
jgi:hypothetical protein